MPMRNTLVVLLGLQDACHQLPAVLHHRAAGQAGPAVLRGLPGGNF